MTSTEMIQISKAEYDALIALKTKFEHVSFELDQLKKMIFGSKSERFTPVSTDPQQMALFDVPAQDVEPTKEQITYTRTKAAEEKKQPVRSELPAHLPRVERVIEVEDLPEGAKRIGDEVSEYLEYESAKLFVVKIIRPKYVVASTDESTTIAIASMPELPLPKSNAGPGLLGHLMISKYVDHLPFYRQVQMLKRMGVTLAESTISGWFKGTCELLEPLYGTLVEMLLKTDYLMADETPIPVLTNDKPGSTHKGYYWVYADPVQKMAVFDYHSSRGREGPRTFLQSFSGYLQTDGYTAYNDLSNPNITLLACMAHARRKFKQAEGNDPVRAEAALKMFQQLYAIERSIKEAQMDDNKTHEYRLEHSQPILSELKTWLDNNIMEVAPAGAISKAIAYTLNLWPRLMRYLEQGRFHIDNNLIENTIRPVALGRKNYLFAGSHDAAQNAAMFYSLMSTCKLNDVNPEQWLQKILSEIKTYPKEKLHELLPCHTPVQ
jgi:transposase